MAEPMTKAHTALSNPRRWLTLLALLSVIVPLPGARAQAAPSCPPTTTLDQLPKAIDDAVSGPGNKDRTCLRAVLMPEVRLIPVSVAADGQVKTTTFTVDDYIERVAKRGDKPFYEHQIKYATKTYGNMAQLWSTYTVTETPDGKPIVRGINSIEAVNDGTRWRVLEISWQAETPATPIPAQFLP
jgi:hypothetical protein